MHRLFLLIPWATRHLLLKVPISLIIMPTTRPLRGMPATSRPSSLILLLVQLLLVVNVGLGWQPVCLRTLLGCLLVKVREGTTQIIFQVVHVQSERLSIELRCIPSNSLTNARLIHKV
jgi:hypothetical protein